MQLELRLLRSSVWPVDCGRKDGMSLLKSNHIRHCDFSFGCSHSFVSFTLGAVSCHVTRPMKRLTCWGMKFFFKQTCEHTFLQADYSIPENPSDDYSPSQYLYWDLLRNFKPEPPSTAAPEILTHKNGRIINVSCFKPLKFRVIWHIDIERKYIMKKKDWVTIPDWKRLRSSNK